MEVFTVLAATNDPELTMKIREAASALPNTSLLTANSFPTASELLQSFLVDLAIVDVAIEEWQGINLVAAIRHAFSGVSIVMVTDKQIRDQDREAIKHGVDGFLVRPILTEHLEFQISHMREMRRLREQVTRLRQEGGPSSGFDGIIGTCKEMRDVFRLVARGSESTVPVAIYGESGTGKELIAQAIHRHSARSEGPFVSVNPSAIPESLLEGELFGHVRGAFTGAATHSIGYFEAANGGTLFLDEIGELPLPLQAKFLRVLQEKRINRIGSTPSIPVDFRLVTATNRDLMAEVKEGRFREDLFYRIHVFPIFMPPLRSRRSDIPILAEHFVRLYARQIGRPSLGFGPGILETLLHYSWPGNVRELENLIHRIVAMKSEGSLIEASDLTGLIDSVTPLTSPQPPATAARPRSASPVPSSVFPAEVKPLQQHVAEYVAWAYQVLGQNKARTARLLEIDRTTLYRKLREAGTGPPEAALSADASPRIIRTTGAVPDGS